MSAEESAPANQYQRELTRMRALIDDLRALPAEVEWVEFKENNTVDRRAKGTLLAG